MRPKKSTITFAAFPHTFTTGLHESVLSETGKETEKRKNQSRSMSDKK